MVKIYIQDITSDEDKKKLEQEKQNFHVFFDMKFSKIWPDILTKGPKDSVEKDNFKDAIFEACFNANKYYCERGNIYKVRRKASKQLKNEKFYNKLIKAVNLFEKDLSTYSEIQKSLIEAGDLEGCFVTLPALKKALTDYKKELNLLESRNVKSKKNIVFKNEKDICVSYDETEDHDRIIGNIFYPRDIGCQSREISPQTCLAINLELLFRLWTSHQFTSDSKLEFVTISSMKYGKPCHNLISKILSISFQDDKSKKYTPVNVLDLIRKVPKKCKIISWKQYTSQNTKVIVEK